MTITTVIRREYMEVTQSFVNTPENLQTAGNPKIRDPRRNAKHLQAGNMQERSARSKKKTTKRSMAVNLHGRWQEPDKSLYTVKTNMSKYNSKSVIVEGVKFDSRLE